MLRSKAGEANALRRLSAMARKRTVPLITLLPQSPAKFVSTLADAWAGLPLGLDGTLDPSSFKESFRVLGEAGVGVMPVISQDARQGYVDLASKVVGRYGKGQIVTATLGDLSTAPAWISSQGWKPEETDLVLVLGDIAAVASATFTSYVAHVLETFAATSPPWRSLTTLASSAPQDYSTLTPGRTDVARLEWTLWKGLTAEVPFHLDFGDTGHLNPSLAEPPGFAMARATVSVRYTVDDYWIVLKGKSTSGASGVPMNSQYLKHAQTLVKDPAFNRLAECWADEQIRAIAGEEASSGNRTTWATIGMNRHIEFIADRLP